MAELDKENLLDNLQDRWDKEAPAVIILCVLATAMVLGALITGGVTLGAAVIYHLDPNETMQKLISNPDRAVRSFFRISQGASHLVIFVMASIFTILALLRAYKIKKPYFTGWANTWRSYFNLEQLPSLYHVILGIALLLFSIPLVQYSYAINKALPLADWMRSMESQTAEAIKGLLIMDSPLEFIGNLLVIAILPALGEELVFRGILQPQLQKITESPWSAILITALIFSAIHMQFEGFLPRFLLGVVLGWLYWQTRNLWVPILAHLFNNGVQVFGIYLFKSGITELDIEKDVDVPWYFAALALLGMLGIGYLLMKKTPSLVSEKK
jgi:uncharacterized protein